MKVCNGWPDSQQERNALIPHPHAYNNQMECIASYYRVHVEMAWRDCNEATMRSEVIASKYGRTNPQRWLERGGIAPAMRWTSSSSNPQATIRTPKMIVKYYLEFYLHRTIIPSLIHLHDQASYAWIQTDTISIHTEEECRTLRRFHISFGGLTFNSHHPCGIHLHRIYRYQLPGTSVFIYRVITVQRISQWLDWYQQGIMIMLASLRGYLERINEALLKDLKDWSRGQVLG